MASGIVKQETVFITGASGYLGSHVLHQALDSGYSVRATARGKKADYLVDYFAKAKNKEGSPNVEVIKIEDIVTHDFGNAFNGVSALIHTASPLAGTEEPESMFQGAVEGTLNVVRQAAAAGVKKIIVTGSLVSTFNSRNTFNHSDWNELSKEKAFEIGDIITIYVGSKVAAELALWTWAEAHPEVEVTSLLPSLIYGPLAPSLYIPEPNLRTFSTALITYNLIHPEGTWHSDISFRAVDVRDVAALHIKAITAPPTSQVGRKRLVLASPFPYEYASIKRLIEEERPLLKSRILREEPPVPQKYLMVPGVDFGRIDEVLGGGDSQKVKWTLIEDTVLDTIDSLLVLEERWKAAGYEVPQIEPWGETTG